MFKILVIGLSHYIALGALILGMLSSCDFSSTTNHSKSVPIAKTASSLRSPQNRVDQKNIKDIKEVDFSNLDYPAIDSFKNILPTKTFQTTNGFYSYEYGNNRIEFRMQGAVYDQITGKDTTTDAVVVFAIYSGAHGTIGSGRSHCVYMYSLSEGQLELTWSFETGDRSAGGLRNIYGEDGNLVIEIYNSDVFYNSKGNASPGGACCAKTYTKAVYEWTGFRFQLIEAKKLNNSIGSASLELGAHKRNQ